MLAALASRHDRLQGTMARSVTQPISGFHHITPLPLLSNSPPTPLQFISHPSPTLLQLLSHPCVQTAEAVVAYLSAQGATLEAVLGDQEAVDAIVGAHVVPAQRLWAW